MTAVTIVIPTLNEAENIDILLERLFLVRQATELSFDVLFVDSASTDGTGDRVLAWYDKGPVRLLPQKVNVGLAGAVIAGARATESRFLVVMDADLSHPPEVIPDLLTPLFAGTHDMVIGSRYVKGGGTPDWPLSRRLSSRLATIPAKMFCSVHDPLAGFFAVERKRLVELPGCVPGFKIGFAVLAEHGRRLRVKEIPIVFRDRDLGESKMNRRVIFDYLRQLVGLARRRFLRH